jgi:hypothetical protein
MEYSVFFEFEFLSLIVFSLILPIGLCVFMFRKRAISRYTVGVAGGVLIAMAGVDIFLLKRLATMVADTPSLLDDFIFSSELSIALYLLPAVFAGIGVNMISHVLINHLIAAEKRFDEKLR